MVRKRAKPQGDLQIPLAGVLESLRLADDALKQAGKRAKSASGSLVQRLREIHQTLDVEGRPFKEGYDERVRCFGSQNADILSSIYILTLCGNRAVFEADIDAARRVWEGRLWRNGFLKIGFPIDDATINWVRKLLDEVELERLPRFGLYYNEQTQTVRMRNKGRGQPPTFLRTLIQAYVERQPDADDDIKTRTKIAELLRFVIDERDLGTKTNDPIGCTLGNILNLKPKN